MDGERAQLQDKLHVLQKQNKDLEQDEEDSLPLEEQLENAKSQVKDLQEYIKKQSMA